MTLAPADHIFSPALSVASYSYHAFERGDFNGDGHLDLLLANFRNEIGSKVRLPLYTNANHRFAQDTTFAPSFESYECLHVARACDFDQDGDLDVAVTGYWAPVRVYVNSGKGLTNSPIVLGDEHTTTGHSDLDWGDVDGDGRTDLAACVANPHARGGKISLYLQRDGGFQAAGGAGTYSHWYTAVRVCDLNRDGRPEIIAANRRGSVAAFLNNGGTLASSPYFAPAQGYGATALDVADIDADGFPEIVTVDEGRIVIFHNGPSGLSSTPHCLDTQLRSYAKDIRLADLNADGFPELLVANYNTRSAIFLNRGGAFVEQPVWLSSRAEPCVRIHVDRSAELDATIVTFAKARGATPEFYYVVNRPVLGDLLLQGDHPALQIENLVPGKTYGVERCASLAADAWTSLLQFQSAGPATNWTDLDPGPETQRFYRVRRIN